MSTLQSILFNNNKFSIFQARKWLNINNMKPIKKVDKTKNYLRYRLRKPKKNKKFRIINLKKNGYIKAVIMF